MSAFPTPVLDGAADRAIEQNLARAAAYRAAVNRSNAQHSTGPRTEAGKQRSSLNALRHGLTAQTVVLPSEDPAAYETHRRQFLDEYQPATATETQLVQELIDTSWRLNRIPLLEADLLARAANPPNEQAAISFDIVDAHRLIANLNLQGTRLSRQFQNALDKLRQIQADRQDRERRDLRDAAALLELYKHKQQPWDPADHGFVFTKHQVERASERMLRQNEARHVAYVRFEMPPQMQPAYNKHTY
ncbi:MAG TPA: hypothetical protein VLW65_00180 [Bryobacteraceae bacterium]|nr:hypothetical protein [Bryobacteraceae bacterium]